MSTITKTTVTEHAFTITLDEEEAELLFDLLHNMRHTGSARHRDFSADLRAGLTKSLLHGDAPENCRWHTLEQSPRDVLVVRGRKPGAHNDNRRFVRIGSSDRWKVNGSELETTRGNNDYYDWFEPWDR